MSKVAVIWDEDGNVTFDSLIKNDLDILVELIISEVKMSNWWVVANCIKEGKSVDTVIENMKVKCKQLLIEKGIEENCFNSVDYFCDFESNNIMSGEFSIGMCDVDSEMYNIVKKLDGYEVDDDKFEEYDMLCDQLREVSNDVMISEDICNVYVEVVNMFGNEEKGILKDIVKG